MNIVNKNLKYGAHTACQMLIEEAERRWKVEEGDYRDDVSVWLSIYFIACLLVCLPC